MAGDGVPPMFATLLRLQPSNRLGDCIIPAADSCYRPCFSGLLLRPDRRRRSDLRHGFGKSWDRLPGGRRPAVRPKSDERGYYALGLKINVEAFEHCLPCV
jgi:hypothetical protein